MQNCTTCKHFRPWPNNKDYGECRRYPPTPHFMVHPRESYWENRYPLVGKDDDCGEWRITLKKQFDIV